MNNLSCRFPAAACLLILLILLVGAVGTGQASRLDECNRFYHDSAYRQALRCYENAASSGISAELLYNIGNTYVQLGQSGYGVLFYLRAQQLTPYDSDIEANLALVRKKAGLFLPAPTVGQRLSRLLSLTHWSLAIPPLLVGYFVLLLFRARGRLSRVTEIFLSLLFGIVLILLVSGTLTRYREWRRSVVVEDTRLLIAPFADAESLGSIRQGRLVSVDKRHQAYLFVSDEAGRHGWITASAAKPIMAETEHPDTEPRHEQD